MQSSELDFFHFSFAVFRLRAIEAAFKSDCFYQHTRDLLQRFYGSVAISASHSLRDNEIPHHGLLESYFILLRQHFLNLLSECVLLRCIACVSHVMRTVYRAGMLSMKRVVCCNPSCSR